MFEKIQADKRISIKATLSMSLRSLSSTVTEISTALLKSLIQGPLLIKKLPEASPFPQQDLVLPEEISPLKLEQKLGHLYEDALAQLLNSSPRYDLLAQNLQIQKDQHHTVGELDFLLRDLEKQRLIHLELATKFYLAVPSEKGLALPGPDARDNYFKKLARLRTHQLQLPSLFKEQLPPEFCHENIKTQHLIYGCLFDHISTQTPSLPEHLNPNCRRGKWLRINEVPTHFSTRTKFHLIPKPLWPVPLDLLQNHKLDLWHPKEALERCTMVRIIGEQSTYFITPENYPSKESVSP